MKGTLLMKKLEEADGIEESAIDGLTHIIQFYLDHGFSFAASRQADDEIRAVLKKLHDDSERHKRILEETRALIGGSDDDF